jgi:hypothetical protein
MSWVVMAAVSWTATPFNPPSFPLAVRSPYLSCWLPQGSGTALNAAWPAFWTGSVSPFHRFKLRSLIHHSLTLTPLDRYWDGQDM